MQCCFDAALPRLGCPSVLDRQREALLGAVGQGVESRTRLGFVIECGGKLGRHRDLPRFGVNGKLYVDLVSGLDPGGVAVLGMRSATRPWSSCEKAVSPR